MTKKLSKTKKIIITILILFIIGLSSFLFLLYGPYKNFRNWLITTAMTTMSHQYLATMFYNQKTIDEVLKENYVKESGENTDDTQIIFNSYKSSSMYLNKYEKEILTKEKGNDLYKKIDITGNGLFKNHKKKGWKEYNNFVWSGCGFCYWRGCFVLF